MTTQHTVRAVYEAGNDGDGIEVEITFTCSVGRPEQGPSYDSGGQPAEPAEVDFIAAKPVDAALSVRPDPAQQPTLDAWAREWLQGEGYADALNEVDFDDDCARALAGEMQAEMAREP